MEEKDYELILERSDPSAHKSALTEDRFFQEMVQNEVQDLKETYGLKKAKEIVQARKPADPFNVAFEQAVWESLDRLERWNFYSGTVLPGWWPILDKYMPQFRALDPNCEFYIKEKFGYLRIRAISQTLPASAFLELSQQAERESSSVCEYCGKPGKIRPKMSWRKTLCDRCYRLNKAGKNKAAREAERRWIEQQE